MTHYDKQIRVVATKRSGHHAVMDWVSAQLPWHHVDFFNDIGPGKPILKNKVDPLPTPQNKSGAHKRALMYNYEDVTPYDLWKPVSTWRTAYDGLPACEDKITLLVLRDPLNTMASRWVFEQKAHWVHPRVSTPNEQQLYVDCWMMMFDEFSGRTKWLQNRGGTVLPVSYNQWADDPSYRAYICSAIGGQTPDDRTMANVPQYGWGSSFKSPVGHVERYKQMLHIPQFRRLCKNWKITEAGKAFGIQYEID